MNHYCSPLCRICADARRAKRLRVLARWGALGSLGLAIALCLLVAACNV